MKFLCFVILAFLISCNANTEIVVGNNYEKKDFKVSGKVKGILSDSVKLLSFYGHQTTIIDTAKVDGDGHFTFKLGKETPPGIYRILLGKSIRAQFLGGGDQFVDLIFAYEDIDFETHFDLPFDSMKVVKSDENKLYYEYLLKKDETLRKLEILQQSLQHYPRSDDFYKVLAKEFDNVYNNFDDYINNIINRNPGKIIAKVVDFEKRPYTDPLLPKKLRDKQARESFFGEKDFTDTLLLFTDLIPAKIIRYLSLYRDETYSQEVQEAEFINAVDVIMAHTTTHDEITNSILNYLIEGFEQFDMETALLHIYDNYVIGNACFDDDRMASLKDRTEAIRRMGTGQPAPDFSLTDVKGRKIGLHDIDAAHTLIAFWASWCAHCTSVMPELHTLYETTDRKDLEVVSIALENEKNEWLDYIQTHNFSWIDYSSIKGWDCPIARDYFIFGTPTFLLLDKNKNILAKPLNIRDLKTYF